jgi:hypothetical protein
MAKVKWGAIILSAIFGISLGGIIQESVCNAAQKDLGSGTLVMKASCAILSVPIDWIVLLLALVGLIYLIWRYYSE